MWDSAKKPIKVRSVLQPNGMRHFIVNEETEEIHTKPLLQQRRNSNKTSRPSASEGETFTGQQQQQSSNEKHTLFGAENSTFSESLKNKERVRRDSIGNSCPLLLCSNTYDIDDRWASSLLSPEQNGNFFGVSGSKIYNSKMYKGQYSRHFHQFPHGTKSNVEITRYPHLRTDVLDFIPVKSPVIKKLINGRVNNSDHHQDNNNDKNQQRPGSNQRNGAPSTTLCSRIMTWIDLEVKRNAGSKGKSRASGSLSFNTADLSIVNELTLPGDYDQSKIANALSSSPLSSESGGSSSASSSSGESTNTSSCMSSSSSTCSSSTVSLPKLIPCWRKEGTLGAEGNNNKAKKSVRIAEDLPRWGKMKRRLRKKALSLNELYEDELFPSQNCKTDYNISKQQNRKSCYSSVSDLLEERSKLGTAGDVSWNGGDRVVIEDGKETDSFLVRDERLLTSGKLQVHIFLPQTESASGRVCENTGNLSGRSEDSTS